MAGLPFADTQETFDTSGDREDLSDLIYNIDPVEVPFIMLAGRGSASSFKHEWQMDRLDIAADNAQTEGLKIETADVSAVRETIRVANYTQISQKSISVTGTLEVIQKAGRNSELSFQLAKRAKELKRDIEFQCVGNTPALGASVAGATGTPRRSASVQASFHVGWTTTATPDLPGVNISRGAGAGADGGYIEATDLFAAQTDGTQRALLESALKSVIQGAWTNGGDPTVILVGPFNKTVISGFTGNSTRYDRGEDKRLVAAVDIYVSDFGEHRVVPNRFQRERDVFAITPELFSIDYLRPFRQHALAKIGDSEDRTLLAEWTLKHSNNAGHGIVADVTTS